MARAREGDAANARPMRGQRAEALETREHVYDCAIVGGGPAGAMAALALARLHRDVVLIDAGASRANYMPLIYNCPGFPLGISGAALLGKLHQQCRGQGVVPVVDKVRRVAFGPRGYRLESERAQWQALTVVIATGVVDRLPAWPGIELGLRSGLVRPCADCDPCESADRRVAVYGSGETAFRCAVFMRTFSSCVTLVDPNSPGPDQSLRKLALDQNIDVLQAKEADCRLQDDHFVVRTVNGSQAIFDVVYVALGTSAHTTMLDGLGILTMEGRLRIDEQCETSVPGLFAIGDTVPGVNQIGVAFGHAAIATTAIHQRLPARMRDRYLVEQLDVAMDSAH